MSSHAIGIIPARWASTRFPGKPLSMISGKTLLQRVYENAAKCKALAKVVVATDDERIFDHVKGFGGAVVMTSPDCPSGTDRLADAVEKHPICQNYPIVVNVQGDEPCLDPEVMEQAVRLLLEDPEAVAATTIAKLKEEDAFDPSVVKCVTDQKGNALYFSRALIPGSLKGGYDPNVCYYRHMGLYAYRADFLKLYGRLSETPLQLAEGLEQLKVLEHGFKMKAAVVEACSIEVNHPEDIQKVENYLWQQNLSS